MKWNVPRYVRYSLALIALGSLPLAASQGADQRTLIVQQYEGNGALNTRPFTVSQAWEVQWNASGDLFALYLHDGSGDLVDVAASQMGSGSGSSFFPKPGTYYFQVNTLGPWSLRIVHATIGPTPIDRAPAVHQGNGIRSTHPFTATGPWELQWEASGDYFGVYVYDAEGTLVDVAANQSGAGPGASYQPRAGTYYLQVNAMGAWSLRVVAMR